MTKKQVLKHTVSYEDGLIKSLKDPEEARAYLEVHWLSMKQVVRLMGCYWPCAMSSRHKVGLVY